MPIYEFECQDCDERFEKLMRLSDDTSGVECPECGGRHTRKLMSTFGVGVGGSGRALNAASVACGPVG